MDRLTQRLDVARKAFTTFAELVGEDAPDAIVRDAAIQRFEYTFEACWKAGQAYLVDAEGVQASSPKQVLRECGRSGVLDTQMVRQGLEMVDDRNLTVHTYSETLANAIYGRLAGHAALLDRWLQGMGSVG
jgi:nucleotidyltransferase substrate binding protein (TIGR01987 family)